MTNILRDIIRKNRAGQLATLPSVCSAHPDVLLAALLLAQSRNQPIIIEATSNQVNQDGGYTGMKPADFVAFVNSIAARIGFDVSQIAFGGDHIGPQVWRSQTAEIAMKKAKVMVAEYVQAGFTKIHLDCSEGCLGEAAQVDDDLSASRAAQLAAICEKSTPHSENLSYMVGTEVPPPGGAREVEKVIPTRPNAARVTLQKHFEAIDAVGISSAKSRIAALVVQPGVEFSADHIDHLPKTGNPDFRTVLNPFEGVCLEAHSTDYQHASAYAQLAEMGFAIQKVGPALTFAYRKAIYALEMLANSLGQPSGIVDVMEDLMLASPGYWQAHYHGDVHKLKLLRHYSYADRIRYYWTASQARETIEKLLATVDAANIPEPVWTQFFCENSLTRAAMLRDQGFAKAKAHILAEIQLALDVYFINSKGG